MWIVLTRLKWFSLTVQVEPSLTYLPACRRNFYVLKEILFGKKNPYTRLCICDFYKNDSRIPDFEISFSKSLEAILSEFQIIRWNFSSLLTLFIRRKLFRSWEPIAPFHLNAKLTNLDGILGRRRSFLSYTSRNKTYSRSEIDAQDVEHRKSFGMNERNISGENVVRCFAVF